MFILFLDFLFPFRIAVEFFVLWDTLKELNFFCKNSIIFLRHLRKVVISTTQSQSQTTLHR
jgi:hypothetical protein